MGTEFLSDDVFTGDIATLPLGAMASHQAEKELEMRSAAADNGFLWTTWAGMKSSPIVNAVADFVKNKGDYRHSVQDAADWDDSYDWHDDVKKYEGLYPKEIFIGSMSASQSRRAMADYDGMVKAQLSMRRHPVASFLGNIGGFSVDMAALSFIPFIGGLGGVAGRAAAAGISNSILRGAVGSSIAFALDVAEVNLARGLVDDRLVFGKVVEELPLEMLIGGLVGGAFGIAGGTTTSITDAIGRYKIPKQIEGGTKVAVEKFSGEDVAKQAYSLFERVKDVDPNITQKDVSTFVETVGGVEENSIQTTSSKIMLSKLACDPTTRAYSSDVPFVRNMARKLHDSHLVDTKTNGRSAPSRSLDISVRTMQNELQGRAKMILEEGYKKLTDDLNNYKISKEEFNKLVGKTLSKNGKLEGAYDSQFSHYVEDTAQRYINDVRDPVQDAFLRMKKSRHGKELIDQSKKAAERAQKKYEKAIENREKFGSEALEENIAKEHSKHLKTAINKGLIKSPEAIEHSKILQIGRTKKRFSKLREKAEKSSEGQVQESLLKELEMSEKKSIGEILRESDAKGKQYNDYSNDVLKKVTSKLKKQSADAEKEFSSVAEELEVATKLLKEREGGTFESDIERWLQSNDEGYTHRMYDFKKILANPDGFINDVAEKLVQIEGLSPSDALTFANELHFSLITNPVGRKFNTTITLRGAEKHRTLQVATEVVENWLDTDAQKMAEKWSDSVIPDSVLQERIGTYDANDFGHQIREEIQELVKSGKILSSESNDLYRTSISQIQRMIDNVRGISYIPDGAVYSASAWRTSGAIRSLQSIVSMGGLVFSSLFDVASMMVNKGVFRALRHDCATFLKYIFQKNFRESLKNHPDLTSMSGWLEAVLRKGTNRTLAEHGIPTNFATKTTEFFRKASQLQQKITGAESIFHALHLSSDYGNLLTIARVAENVARGKALSVTEKNILNLARISEKECLDIAHQVSKYGITENGVRHFNLNMWENSDVAHAVRYGVNALTKNSILTPANEVPAIAKTPLGEVLFQYKKFIFASIDRCFLPTLGRLSSGEISILGGIFSMVAIGGLKESLSRLVAGKEPLTAQEFWLYGIGNCDALPLIGEIIKDVSLGFSSNGVTGGFQHAQGWLHDYFVPPAVSQSIRGIKGMNGITEMISGKRRMNTSELRAIKSCIPYNNAIYFNWLMNKWVNAYSDGDDMNFGVKY